MIAHPEGHVREDHGGDQVRHRFEDGLDGGARVGVDREVGRHARCSGEDQGCADAGEDVDEVPALADPVEVGQQDRHDHAGLDPLPEKDHEGRYHRK